MVKIVSLMSVFDVSVVIPAYNEEGALRNCLASLRAQKTSRSFEIIVVDNNSTDGTAAIAGLFGVRLIAEMRQGRGAARAAGFKVATGHFLLSTDADTVVPEGWIEEHAMALENYVATVGTTRVSGLSPLATKFFDGAQPLYADICRVLFRHYWLVGFNFGIRREVYEAAGGFDASLNAMEDVDLSFRVYKLGQVRFLRHLKVVFSGRRFKKGLIRGMVEYFVSFYHYYFKTRKPTHLSNIR